MEVIIMKLSKPLGVSVIIVLILLCVLVFMVPFAAQAQTLPPEDPSEPWSPPDEGEGSIPFGGSPPVLSEGGVPPAPGAQCAILSAFMQDELGNGKTEFIGKEQIYLNLTASAVPGNRTTLHIAEYFPTGTLTRHWLIYNWPVSASGTWRFGPYYAQPLEPEGIHSWRIWLTDRTTQYQDHYLVRFNYFSEEQETEAEKPALVNISTSVTTTLSSLSINDNETVTVFGTVTPPNSGSVMIEQTKDGLTWIPITSGTATGTVIGQFTPTEPGSYIIRSKYTGYMDNATNQQYLASESSPLILEVAKGFNYLALGIGIGIAVIAGVVIWLWRSKRFIFGRPDTTQGGTA